MLGTRPSLGATAALLAAAVGLALPAASPAQQSDAEWLAECERDRDRGESRYRHCELRVTELPATGRLAVESDRNGGVAVRAWERGSERDVVEVHARIAAWADDPSTAEALAGRVEIGAEGERLRPAGPEAGDDGSWSVVYHVRVPSRYDLDLSAYNGPVAVRGVTGSMELETRNGPIALRGVGGDVRARAENGPIAIELSGDRWDGAGLDAEARNGPIRLEIPEGYSADLVTGTVHGPTRIGFPLTVTLGGEGRLGRRGGHFRATLGEGGAPIRAVTTNGPLVLRRP